MKLINVETLQIETFFDEVVPCYSILSHTWDVEEVSFQDFQDLESAKRLRGFAKIRNACRLAKKHGLKYAWVDTCCIDKTSSAELSESINSMFRYYKESSCCYVYLSDFENGDSVENCLHRCKWFTRGWTLQELIAPVVVRFYNHDWKRIGTKTSLREEIYRITGIPLEALLGETQISEYPVATRMAWAASRSTTRVEDVAYSLLGVFEVNMPMLYGEGRKAFRRLQEEIFRQSSDASIFAWGTNRLATGSLSVFAESPFQFAGHENSQPLTSLHHDSYMEKMEMTDRGPSFTKGYLYIVSVPSRLTVQTSSSYNAVECAVLPTAVARFAEKMPDTTIRYVLGLGIRNPTHVWGIFLEKIKPSMFRRDQKLPLALMPLKQNTLYAMEFQHEFFISNGRVTDSSDQMMHVSRADSMTIVCGREIVIKQVFPKTSWDSCRRLLLAHRLSDQVQAVKFRFESQLVKATFWLLYDLRWNLLSVRLFETGDNQVARKLLSILNQTEHRNCSWEELELEVPAIRKSSNGIKLFSPDSDSPCVGISVSLTTTEVEREGFSVSVHTVQIDAEYIERQKSVL